MLPFVSLAVGLVTGAAGVVLLGPRIAQQARPVAKAVLKAALAGMREAQVRGTEIAEATEDLYAEAKAEVTAEVFAAAMAAAQVEAAAQAAQAKAQEPPAAGPKEPTTKAARRRTAVKRSRGTPSANG